MNTNNPPALPATFHVQIRHKHLVGDRWSDLPFQRPNPITENECRCYVDANNALYEKHYEFRVVKRTEEVLPMLHEREKSSQGKGEK